MHQAGIVPTKPFKKQPRETNATKRAHFSENPLGACCGTDCWVILGGLASLLFLNKTFRNCLSLNLICRVRTPAIDCRVRPFRLPLIAVCAQGPGSTRAKHTSAMPMRFGEEVPLRSGEVTFAMSQSPPPPRAPSLHEVNAQEYSNYTHWSHTSEHRVRFGHNVIGCPLYTKHTPGHVRRPANACLQELP